METAQQPNIQQALPLHLTLAIMPLLASRTALQLSKHGFPRLSVPLPDMCPLPIQNLQKAWLDLQSDPLLAEAVEKEAEKRTAELLSGVTNYNRFVFSRDVAEPPTVLQIGNARLLDYGSADQNSPVLFLIPSLINRYYILDLTQKLSFARYLRSLGIRVFIVDWGSPSDAEKHFNTGLYVTEILVPMAERIREKTTTDITLGGYCMGGLLALALACIRSDLADNIAFFTTPWDFSTPAFPRFAMQENEITALKASINSRREIPAELIHILFHYANPLAFQNKLREFAHLAHDDQAAHDFLAVEHWANDGVPMTRGVAEDCLIGWVQHNQPANKQWHVGGQIIDPTRLRMPCFVAAPQDDRIVPSDCALPLAGLLRNCTLIEPHSGHVSMMAGRSRKSALWEPFCEWLFTKT